MTSQISLVRRGNVAGSAGQVGATASAGWVEATASVTGLVLVRQACVAGRARPTPPLRGRADVVVGKGEGTGAS